MNEISKEEFENRNGNPMAAVSADDREFYDLGEDQLGVIARREGDKRVRITGHILRPAAPFNGQFRVNETKSESGRFGDGEERAREKVEEWLS